MNTNANASPSQSAAESDAIRGNAHILSAAGASVQAILANAKEVQRLLQLLSPLSEGESMLAMLHDLKRLSGAVALGRQECLVAFARTEDLIARHVQEGVQAAMQALGLMESTGVTGTATGNPALDSTTESKTLPPKAKRLYRSPDGLNTWSGFGRRPAWIATAAAQGIDLATFLVPESTPASKPAQEPDLGVSASQAEPTLVAALAPAPMPTMPADLRGQAWPSSEDRGNLEAIASTSVEAANTQAPAETLPNADDDAGSFSAEADPEPIDAVPDAATDSAFVGPTADETGHDLDSFSADAAVSHDLSVPHPLPVGTAAPAPVDDAGLDSFMGGS